MYQLPSVTYSILSDRFLSQNTRTPSNSIRLKKHKKKRNSKRIFKSVLRRKKSLRLDFGRGLLTRLSLKNRRSNYDPERPRKGFRNKQQRKLLRRIAIIAGVALVGIGIYQFIPWEHLYQKLREEIAKLTQRTPEVQPVPEVTQSKWQTVGRKVGSVVIILGIVGLTIFGVTQLCISKTNRSNTSTDEDIQITGKINFSQSIGDSSGISSSNNNENCDTVFSLLLRSAMYSANLFMIFAYDICNTTVEFMAGEYGSALEEVWRTMECLYDYPIPNVIISGFIRYFSYGKFRRLLSRYLLFQLSGPYLPLFYEPIFGIYKPLETVNGIVQPEGFVPHLIVGLLAD